MSTITALRRTTPVPADDFEPSTAPAVDAGTLASITAQLASTAADHDLSGAFPHANLQLLQQHGLVALVVPRALGGGGASLATARSVIAAVAGGEPATALVLTMTYLQHHAITRAEGRWPSHLRARIANDAVRAGALMNALRVEPALGSPARGGLPDTVATRCEQGWRIRGHKLYTTGIEGLAWLNVWGRTDEPQPRVGSFLVPRDAPGIRIIASWDHLGMRASGSHEVVFDDVLVPADHAADLRAPADWAPGASSPAEVQAFATQQAWMVVLLGSLYDAVARAARDWLVGFLNTRAPGSLSAAPGRPEQARFAGAAEDTPVSGARPPEGAQRPDALHDDTPLKASLATLPRVQERMGEIEALLRTNRVLLDEETAAVDAGRPPAAVDTGLLKHTVTTQAIRAVELALQLSGNHGLTRHNPLERHWRDVQCGRVHTPQDDAVLVAAGRRALAG